MKLPLGLACSLLGLAGVAMIGATPASAACQLKLIAEIPVTMEGNAPLVDVKINGHDVKLMLDSGSAVTALTPSAAADLGLKAYESDFKMYGVGGGDTVGRTTVQEMKLGTAVVHNIQLLVTGRGIRTRRFAGLLGEDFLSQTDVELDLAGGVIRLLRADGCQGDQVVYWGKAYSVAPILASNTEGKLETYVNLNGERIVAVIDTGAYTSVVTTSAAEHAGVTPHSEGVHEAGMSSGVGSQLVQTSVAVFPTFSIGEETIKNAKLRIADLFGADTEVPIGSHIAEQVMDFPQMLLGADFVRTHRIYIARSQGKIYFSYNGGQIFQITGPRSGEPANANANAPAAAPAPATPPRKD